MSPETALVVSEATAAAENLCASLNEDDLPTSRLTAAEVLAGWDPDVPAPDLLLVSAELDVEVVRAVAQAIVLATHTSPTVVTFADADFTALEPHVLAGLDYLVPPFLPSLVRSRLVACRERQELTRTVQEIETAAHLLRYERELQIGREIQAGFLPEELPAPDGWEIAIRFEPAREVAGDFYDAFELTGGHRIGFVVADVCDKGIGAALFMALIRSLLRHTANHAEAVPRPPGSATVPVQRQHDRLVGRDLLHRAVDATNDYMTANHLKQGYFATLFFGILDPANGSVSYINCGHNPPALLRADGTRQLLAPTGPALGLLPGSVFDIGQVQLDRGDTLFLYTDGVTEAKDADGAFFTEERMLAALAAPADGATAFLERIDNELHDHVGTAEQFDDITMMALHRAAPVAVPIAPVGG
jgi:sigma-B regulation protein RsbU (phosphoserine phosphatase)